MFVMYGQLLTVPQQKEKGAIIITTAITVITTSKIGERKSNLEKTAISNAIVIIVTMIVHINSATETVTNAIAATIGTKHHNMMRMSSPSG